MNVEMIEAVKEFGRANRFQVNGAPVPVSGGPDDPYFSRETWENVASMGLFSLPFSGEYGGLGETMLTTARCFEAFALNCSDEGLIVSMVTHLCSCAMPLSVHGRPEQKQKYLTKLINGSLIGANAMTEANGGSDVSNMKTMVTTENGAATISGAKIYVTNGPVADLYVVFVRHKGGVKNLDISSVVVERGTPGVMVGQIWKKMGINSSPTSEIILDGTVFDRSMLLGSQCRGLSVFNTSMNWERVLLSAYHLGAMKKQFNQTLEYARDRNTSRGAIIHNQEISSKLVQMKMNIDLTDLLLQRTCELNDCGSPSLSQVAMLKLKSSESRVENSALALRIFGAIGYMKETAVERQIRDSLAATLYAGTSEIQKKTITEHFDYYQG